MSEQGQEHGGRGRWLRAVDAFRAYKPAPVATRRFSAVQENAERKQEMLAAVADRCSQRLAEAAKAYARARRDLTDLELSLHMADAADREAAELESLRKADDDMLSVVATLTDVERIPDAEHVYFIVEDGANFIKIGFSSRSAESRTSSLQTGNPRGMTIAAIMPGPMSLEQQLHGLFRAEHVRGEWFRLSRRLAAFVLEVREGGDVSFLLQ